MTEQLGMLKMNQATNSLHEKLNICIHKLLVLLMLKLSKKQNMLLSYWLTSKLFERRQTLY